MRRSLYTLVGGLVTAAVLVLVLAFIVVPSSTGVLKEFTAVTRSSPAEGIAVHGRWILEVRNPDGTLEERREFENALSSSGSGALISILARQYSVGSWFILLDNTAGARPWRAIGSGTGPGTIYEAGGLAPASYQHFDTLNINTTTSGLVFRGTATAQDDGAINTVATNFYRLSSSSPPSVTSTGATSVELTATTLSSPVTLAAGQTVTVIVTISFS